MQINLSEEMICVIYRTLEAYNKDHEPLTLVLGECGESTIDSIEAEALFFEFFKYACSIPL